MARGRKPKGKRAQFNFMLPEDHLQLYRELASAEGLPVGDYLTARLAERHDLDVPDYIRRSQADLPLPLSA